MLHKAINSNTIPYLIIADILLMSKQSKKKKIISLEYFYLSGQFLPSTVPYFASSVAEHSHWWLMSCINQLLVIRLMTIPHVYLELVADSKTYHLITKTIGPATQYETSGLFTYDY